MGQIIIKRINMTLDPKSIENAINEVNHLQTDIKYALDAVCGYFLERGVAIARVNLMHYGAMRSGDLYKSIRHGAFDSNTGVGYITAGEGLEAGNGIGSYAVLIEFGFGGNYKVIDEDGSARSNTEIGRRGLSHVLTKQVGYKTNINKRKISANHGKSLQPGWIYFNRRENHFYFSTGQPPKPFMYNTLCDLAEEAAKDGGRILAQYIP